MADPLQDYLKALDVLYNHPDPKAKQQADVYLIEFQKQPIAWQISDQILHRAGLPEAAYYYAVGTLYTKIQFNFDELPDAGPRAAFRESLLSHVKRFQSASNAIKTKLALCVASLTVRLLALGEWPNAIGAIVDKFGGDFNNALSLLDILAFLPEENLNQRLRMSPLHRATAQIHILSQSAKILGLLMHYLAQSSTSVNPTTNASQDYISSGILLTPNVGPQAVLLPHVAGQQKAMHTKLLVTFLSWVKAAHPSQRMLSPKGMPELKLNEIWGSENLVEHPLLLFCFKIIASRCDELEQIAIDVLTSLLRNFSVEFSIERNNLAFSNTPGFRKASEYDEDEEGAYEEDFGRSRDGDDGGQYSSGRYAPRNQQEQQQSQKPPVPGELNESENPYKHLYFMRFMATRILNLVPLFDALPAPPADLDDLDDFQSLARYYARLFADLGEYYLQFIVEFCLGPEGFSQLYDALEIGYIKQTMLNHAAFVAKKQNPPAAPASLNESDYQALLVDNQKLAFEIVTLLINCCKNPRRDVNSSAMYFWFLLSENLTQALPRKSTITPSLQQTMNPGSAPVLTPLQVRAKKKQWFQNPFLQMIPNIHRIMTLPPKYAPPGQPSPLSAEAMEEVKKARKQSSETLKDVEKIVGSEAILEMLTSESCMGAQVAAIMADPSKWRDLEASLMMVRVLGKVICHHTEQVYSHLGTDGFATGGKINTVYLPKILEFILAPNSPAQANQALKYTSLELVGRYALWIKEQSRAATAAAAASGTGAPPVEYVGRALGFVVDGLRDLKVVKGAAIAFNRVCDKNRNVLAKANFLPGLFQVYQACCNVNLVDQGITAQGYTLADQKEIIEGVATVVSCIDSKHAGGAPGQPDSTQILPYYLLQLVAPMLTALESFLKQAPPAQPGVPPPQLQLSPDASAIIATNLDRLGETIAKLYPSLSPDREYFLSCLLDMFHNKISPVLYMFLQRASADERRMDKLCRVFKHVIKITKLHFLNVCLPILLENLNQSFSRVPHACFLYLLGVCVEHYGMIPKFHPFLRHMLPAFLSTSVKLIPNLHAMQQSPEMTEDFFQTCTTILDKCPEVFFSLELLPVVIETAIQGLHLQHRESHSALCCFLNHFFLHGVETRHAADEVRLGGPVVPAHANVIQQCLQKYGSIITNACVRGIATQLPISRVEGASRVLEGIVSFCREGCQPWLNDAVSRVPDTIDPTKQEFVQILIDYPDDRSVCNVCMAFAHASRIKDQA